MTGDDWLRLWWVPLLVTIVGGLVIVGILAFFSANVRDKFWRPIGRGLCWLATIRITTTARQNALRESGRKEVRQEVARERAAHRLQPVWRVVRLDPTTGLFAGEYALGESQGVIVWDVHVSAPADLFTFTGPNQWNGQMTERVDFMGKPTEAGRNSGVMFTVRWRAVEHGDWCEGDAWLERIPVQPTVVF